MRALVLAIGVLVIVAGCGRIPGAQISAGDYKLYEAASTSSAQQVSVIDSRSHTVERTIPLGTPSPDWTHLYTVTDHNLVDLDPQTGATFRTLGLPGDFQLPPATFSGVPSGTLGDALDYLQGLAKQMAPRGYSVDFAGQSRQYVQESSSFALTFMFAVIIIFLALSAQFGSFRDPLIVMMSVPMAIFGAMVFIFLGFEKATLNIYTKVGLVTLIGLIAKHGILIVQFANDEQRQHGKSKLEAIMSAAGVRLRPILMTTFSMVLGVVPLVIASGAGAVGRNHMGLVIFTGISIGTLFTLFVVPAMYLFLGADHHEDGKKALEAEPVAPAAH